jgi:hypothetical protein
VCDFGIEWAVIKAVSDFADGSKEKTKLWQPFASTMAASVVYNMFQWPVVLNGWRHYNAEGRYSVIPTPHVSIDQFLKSIAGTTEGTVKIPTQLNFTMFNPSFLPPASHILLHPLK